jgi:hypothetical protein
VLVFAAAAPCVHTHEPERGIALPKYPVIFMKTTATLNCHLGDIWRPNMTGEEDALNPGDSRLLAAARERFSKFCVFPLLGPEFPAGPSRQQESLSASWPLCDWLLCAVHDGDGGPGRTHADGGALDYEAELCIVIGKKCRNATLEVQRAPRRPCCPRALTFQSIRCDWDPPTDAGEDHGIDHNKH